MIQSYLKALAKAAVPNLEWSIDFYTGEDNTGTVYTEGGPPPDSYESGIRYPQYQVLIRSSDWAFAKTAANKIFMLFHGKANIIAEVEDSKYKILFIEAMSEPLRLGVRDEIMEYTINYQVTLREVL